MPHVCIYLRRRLAGGTLAGTISSAATPPTPSSPSIPHAAPGPDSAAHIAEPEGVGRSPDAVVEKVARHSEAVVDWKIPVLDAIAARCSPVCLEGSESAA